MTNAPADKAGATVTDEKTQNGQASFIATDPPAQVAKSIHLNGVPALRVRSIRAGAALTVSNETDRPPRFKRWKPLDLGDGPPPARQIQNSDLLPTEAAE
jgi:hypothetical protein